MHVFRQWIRLAAALAVLGAAGCPGGGGGGDMPPGPPQVQLSVERVFPALSFMAPVAMLQAPNDTSRWFVVEQGGVVRVFPNLPAVAATDVAEFVNLTDRVAMEGEAGLLGMAFHPQFSTNGRVFLFYSHRDAGGNLMSQLSEFTTAIGGATLDPGSEHVLITLPKPNNESNHNGGNLAFSLEPGNLLYVGVGDGGGGNDQHGPIGNAQNPNTLFGKMLRIQILAAPGTYGIPNTNPNFGNSLCNTNGAGSQPCPEIFAIGLRNPWRWSFDRANGQLWVGDVGQGAIEEIDQVVLGGNYGWRCFEGTRTNTGFPCGTPGETKLPIAQYSHSVGQSVTGGYVYRGTRLPGLVGRYIFADFVSGRIFNIDATAQGVLDMGGGLSSGLAISSFGEGLDGELFAVDYNGGLYHIRQ
jgi:glucose/arabinose dehydrogenase